jgi:hypothetical protein
VFQERSWADYSCPDSLVALCLKQFQLTRRLDQPKLGPRRMMR